DRIHGSGVLRGEHFRLMRDGTLLLNVAFPDAVEWDALRAELLQGRLRSAFDAPPNGAYADLPPHIFVTSPRQTAYDTVESNRRLGRMASEALISVLKDGNHPRVINPDFALHRPRS